MAGRAMWRWWRIAGRQPDVSPVYWGVLAPAGAAGPEGPAGAWDCRGRRGMRGRRVQERLERQAGATGCGRGRWVLRGRRGPRAGRADRGDGAAGLGTAGTYRLGVNYGLNDAVSFGGRANLAGGE